MHELLLIGGTGAMGRAVLKHLLASPTTWGIRVLTRDPRSEDARAIQALAPDRVRLYAGSPGDRQALRAAVEGAYGVFCNTNFFATVSVRGEVAEGLACLEAARDAGVQHFVYASLDSLIGLSGGRYPVPHFDAKAAVAAHIDRERSDAFMRRGMGIPGDTWYLDHTTVLVTTAYFENFKSMFMPRRGTLRDGREGLVFELPFDSAGWTMVALDDIGWFTRHVFENAADWRGRTLSLVSEELSGERIAETFSRVTGIPAEYSPLPIEVFEKLPIPFMHDFANMVRCMNEIRPPRDIDGLRAMHPGLLSFEDWLRQTNWRGEPEPFQKQVRDMTRR